GTWRGCDAAPETAGRAAGLGAVAEVAPSVVDAVAGADVVIVAVPVGRIAGRVVEALDAGAPAVTDVGWVKLAEVDAVRAERPDAAARCGCGGPMAGRGQDRPGGAAAGRGAILAALDAYRASLDDVRALVEQTDGAALLETLERGRAARRNLPVGRRTQGPFTELRIPVPDRSGVIAEVASIAQGLGVNI